MENTRLELFKFFKILSNVTGDKLELTYEAVLHPTIRPPFWLYILLNYLFLYLCNTYTIYEIIPLDQINAQHWSFPARICASFLPSLYLRLKSKYQIYWGSERLTWIIIWNFINKNMAAATDWHEKQALIWLLFQVYYLFINISSVKIRLIINSVQKPKSKSQKDVAGRVFFLAFWSFVPMSRTKHMDNI